MSASVEFVNAEVSKPPTHSPLFQADFTESNGEPYLGAGWVAGNKSVISVGYSSVLHLPVGDAAGTLEVELCVEPWLGSSEVLGQLVRIRAENRFIASFVVMSPATLRFDLPSDLARINTDVKLTLEYPCVVRPAMLGSESDERPLALTLHSLRVMPDQQNSDRAPILSPIPSILNADTLCQLRLELNKPADRERVLREGFHLADDGTVWTGSFVNRMSVGPFQKGGILLRINIVPLCFNGGPALQRLTVVLDGFVVGQFQINTETILTMLLPAEILERIDEHHVSLITPDAVRMSRFTPGKQEVLGFSVHWIDLESVECWTAAAEQIRPSEVRSVVSARFDKCNDMPLAELKNTFEDKLSLMKLFSKFESLGDSCTFGLAQRQVGIEVLNLLRFANTPIAGLMKGLSSGFSALNDKASITVEKDSSNEFVVWIREYGIRWHTFQYEMSTTAAKVYEDHVVKLSYLRRKFLEGLNGGQKIYVLTRLNSRRYKRAVPTASGVMYWEAPLRDLQLSEVMAIWQELNRGRTNTLLYILPSDAAHPSGTVERLAPTLLRGYIDGRMMRANTDLSAWDYSDWGRVLANAWMSRSASFQAVQQFVDSVSRDIKCSI